MWAGGHPNLISPRLCHRQVICKKINSVVQILFDQSRLKGLTFDPIPRGQGWADDHQDLIRSRLGDRQVNCEVLTL